MADRKSNLTDWFGGLLVLTLIVLVSGCSDATVAARRHASLSNKIKRWNKVDDFPTRLAQFQTVFWEPDDTHSLRQLIRRGSYQVKGKTILEIGTGTGLVALCCLESGAAKVLATDVNENAIANAEFNARTLGLNDRLETRLVPLDDSGAFAVIKPHEKFDLIISNPPWEDAPPKEIDDYAFYDPSFDLLHSLLSGLQAHLKPGGKALLAYGCVTAIRKVGEVAELYGLEVVIVDDRDPKTLPEVFLPGMLLEVKIKPPRAPRS